MKLGEGSLFGNFLFEVSVLLLLLLGGDFPSLSESITYKKRIEK